MPELHLRLRRDRSGGEPRIDDVVVVVEPTHDVGDLAAALGRHLGLASVPTLAVERLGRSLAPDLPIAAAGFLAGDLVVLDGDVPPHRSPAGELVAVDVVAGPDSGRSHLVRCPGRYTVGRSADVAIRIDDPSVSRLHATFELDAAGGVTLHPQSTAANGVIVDDAEPSGSMRLGDTAVVALGGTRLAVRPVRRHEAEHRDRLGQIDFHRTPYRPPVVAEREAATVGPVPDRPEPRRLQLLAAVAPLAAGVLMWAFTRQLQFLALTLVSPIVVIGTAVDDRRSGRRAFRERVARWRADLARQALAIRRLRDAERVERFRTAPDLAELIRRAELRTVDLWSRGRGAPDFLSLRLGLGPATVAFPIELQPGGAPDLRDEASAAVAGLDRLGDVPVSVSLLADPVLGLHGEPELVDGAAASILVQAVTLHSPEDLTVVAAIGAHRPLGWPKWLPHARSVTSPLSGDHVVLDTAGGDRLVERLLDVADQRAAAGDRSVAWPRLLVVLDAALGLDPAPVARLLDLAPTAAMSVVWLARSSAEVPRQASRTLVVRRSDGAAMRGRLWSTDPSVPDQELEVEHLRPDLADRVARSLAPVRDASTASLATSIPRTVPLLDLLGVGRPTAGWVAEHWTHARPHGLRFPIGVGADGPIELDLVEDGPHTLVGGTSGAGKSELLQSMVASLAVHHPPTRLNFLFVDYKGGASTQVFERLPHTVGYVTNLSADLAGRALTSLRAELQRRMAILEGRAKDLAELLELAPHDAPASLVIVVDEFATLVREVPEFVAGVVDIAQRGRSLGIHLVLATQRPSGSVDENILANTNLRISLRMLDRTESSAVVGTPDAADIPVPLRGRGLVRLGPRQLVEFQGAFAGAQLVAAEMRPPVLVGPFVGTDDSPRAGAPTRKDGVTQLDALLDAIERADARLGLPEPRRPWCDILPDVIVLDEVLARAGSAPAFDHAGRDVVIGMLDDPEHQDQRPAVVDLEDGGGLLVFGSGGSGKTTVLRTVAASVEATAGAGEAVVVALDFASRGLAGVAALPCVVEVATGDDLDAVTRLLVGLDAELGRRRRRFAEVGAEHLSAYERHHDDALPRIVVLVDGFGGLTDTLLDVSGGSGEWFELVTRLVVDGRQVGIHTVATAERRSAIGARVHAAVAHRLVLRHVDEASYADHGIPADRARRLDLGPGRGLLDGRLLVQTASVSADPSARAQGAAIDGLAARRPAVTAPLLTGAPLPERLTTVQAPAGPDRATIGTADVTGAPVVVDLEWSHLTIAGPPRSGRSTALSAVLTALAPHHDLTVVGPASSPLRRLPPVAGVAAAFGRSDDLAPVLDRLTHRLALDPPGGRTRVLVVDDADDLDDLALGPILDRLTSSDGLRVVAALETQSMAGYSSSALVALARRARRLLVLRPDDPGEFLQTTGVKLALRPGLQMPAGRGVLLVDREPTVVQVVDADPSAVDVAGVGSAVRSGVAAHVDGPLEPEPIGEAERFAPA